MTEVKGEIIKNKPLSKEEVEFQKILQFANMAKLIKKDLNASSTVQSAFQKNFNKDDVMTWLANPARYQKQLRNLSRFLYDASTHYKRLIQYFATMLTFDYVLEPYGLKNFDSAQIEKIRNKYIQIANYLDMMNLKHEFLKVCERAWIDDVAYYYEIEAKDSYFLMQLDPDYCEINGVEDGCFTFAFDFSYFRSRKDEVERFPVEFQQKYNEYLKDVRNKRWQEINPSKSLCVKIAESVDYPISPFAGLSEEIWTLEDYKSLKLAKTELDNYMFLVAQIPYLNNATTANQFALNLDLANVYYEKILGQLPDQVGALISPFEDIVPIRVERSERDTDKVAEAQQAIYDSAGVSQLLFNSGSTASTVTKSILVDENVAFRLLRQFERWVNRKLKDISRGAKFKVEFLDITRLNKDDYIKSLKEGATLGVPNKMRYAAALGQSPASLLHAEFLENKVLDIVDTWKPLKSSYTQSSEGGRPQSDEDDLTDAGVKTRDNDSNNPEVRD